MLGNSRFFWGLGGVFLRNSRIPSPTAGSAFLLRIRWLLRTRWVTLFTLKALRSPEPYAKASARFSALRLKSCRKTFANATATALLHSGSKSKNRSKILELSFLLPLPRVFEFARTSRIH
ncbi:MAG: hypothetical protein MSA54_08285 [Campylobacter sp.]|uniref:hypothetical protein n=1 Tax=Campylobacter sp. TaxID=205 RepID=UPI002AA79FE0|nr:hypothetical protein [Campylobacter sp.]MCI7501906.1 hypothetical protein [Campylobacter sp.]